MNTTTVTNNNTTTTPVAIERLVNEAYAAGRKVTVNGHEVYNPWRLDPASAWGTGSVGIDVRTKARTTGKYRTIYVKQGQSATIVID